MLLRRPNLVCRVLREGQIGCVHLLRYWAIVQLNLANVQGVVVSGSLREMFLQVLMRQKDQHYLRFFWKANEVDAA